MDLTRTFNEYANACRERGLGRPSKEDIMKELDEKVDGYMKDAGVSCVCCWWTDHPYQLKYEPDRPTKRVYRADPLPYLRAMCLWMYFNQHVAPQAEMNPCKRRLKELAERQRMAEKQKKVARRAQALETGLRHFAKGQNSHNFMVEWLKNNSA